MLPFICVPVSVFDRDLTHLSPPKSSASQLCDSAPCQVLLTAEPTGESSTSRPARHVNRTTQSDGAADPGSERFQDIHHQGERSHHLSINERLEKLQTFYSLEKNDMLLEASTRSSDRDHVVAVQSTQMSPSTPLPRLRNLGLKDSRGKRMSWVGLTRPGPPGFLVNGSKPSAFPPQQQHTLAFKGLKQERARRKDLFAAGEGGGPEGSGTNGAKRNTVQLRSSLQHRAGGLNLPLLPAAVQGKTERKNQLHNLDYC